MNCENLATAERFPPILVRAISVFCSIPAHLNSRIISQIHNSLHYGILIKVWAIWNGMQTATHRNMFASHQDRTPTAVHTHPRAVHTHSRALWTSCCTTVPGRNLHNLLPSQPSFPARSTPVRKAATTDTQTHTEAPDAPSQHLGIGKSLHLLCHSFIPQKASFHPGCWQHFWREIAVGMGFSLSGCASPGLQKQWVPFPAHAMKINARSFWNGHLLSLIHRNPSLDQFVTHCTEKSKAKGPGGRWCFYCTPHPLLLHPPTRCVFLTGERLPPPNQQRVRG